MRDFDFRPLLPEETELFSASEVEAHADFSLTYNFIGQGEPNTSGPYTFSLIGQRIYIMQRSHFEPEENDIPDEHLCEATYPHLVLEAGFASLSDDDHF